MNRPRIYLDHAATTPPRPEALAAMAEGLARWANPSSPHAEGRAARAALEDARARVKAVLGWHGEVLFTSGASEGLAIALGRVQVAGRLVSAVEHDAVLRAAPEAGVLPVTDGKVDLTALTEALATSERALVAVQHTNSETGTMLLPLQKNGLIEAVHAAGGLVLCDAAQLGPDRQLPAGVDLAVISGHKLGAPVGIGALLLRDFALLAPSGGQEFGYRPGTENLPGAMALAAVLELGGDSWATSAEQRASFAARLAQHGTPVMPGPAGSHILAVASPRFEARTLLIRLDAMGFAVSAGSACSSGSLKPSRVLQGFGVAPGLAARTIRVSLGWNTTPAELDAFAAAWQALHA
ncbi:MAG: aminotransferase class V-fold PLP-dependent enzyme [Proteobacteria bacterium]|nr:aminotransferase class V-fold PLP-dependent enzyme [Pseudomonadota bacterium]